MAESAKRNHESPSSDASYDPAEFGRKVRQLALDAHQILFCPDGAIDEVFELHRRLWPLVHEACGLQSGGIYRWLLAVRGVIGDRLQSWAEDLESSLA